MLNSCNVSIYHKFQQPYALNEGTFWRQCWMHHQANEREQNSNHCLCRDSSRLLEFMLHSTFIRLNQGWSFIHFILWDKFYHRNHSWQSAQGNVMLLLFNRPYSSSDMIGQDQGLQDTLIPGAGSNLPCVWSLKLFISPMGNWIAKAEQLDLVAAAAAAVGCIDGGRFDALYYAIDKMNGWS